MLRLGPSDKTCAGGSHVCETTWDSFLNRRLRFGYGLFGWFGPPAHGQTNPITNGTISVKLHTVATLPTGTTGAPDFLTTDGVAGDARLFVLGQRGQIRIVNNGSLNQHAVFGCEYGAVGHVHFTSQFVR